MTGPLLTVSLPLYRKGPIAWLALEGLCAQQEAPPWEIVIVQEADETPLSRHELAEYRDGLMRAGCVRAELIEIPRWIPLARKMLIVASASSQTSIATLLHGGDDYSAPLRLARAHGAFASEPRMDWWHAPRGVFYDIIADHLALFDVDTPGHPGRTGVSMSVRTVWLRHVCELMKLGRLPRDRAVGVDGLIFDAVAMSVSPENKINVGADDSEDWRAALYTNGLNNCSAHRDQMMQGKAVPGTSSAFLPIDGAVEDFVPDRIAERLRSLRPLAQAHEPLRVDTEARRIA